MTGTNQYECAAQMCFDLVSASDESVVLKHECNELHHALWTIDELSPGAYVMRAWLELGHNHRALTAPTLERLYAFLQNASTPRRRFYAGQVWAHEKNRSLRPVRDPKSKYYISEEVYPMRDLFPFVNGPAMVFSHDFVEYVAQSRRFLRPLNDLDDVTLAFWALAAGVQPTHLHTFFDARSSASTVCREDFISIRELFPSGIRTLYAFDKSGQVGGVCKMFIENKHELTHNHIYSYARSMQTSDT